MGHIDIAFINGGSIRSNAFPINKGETITVNHVYKIMPFDNKVKITVLTGKQLLNAFKVYDAVVAGNYNLSNGKYYVNGEIVDENATYRVIVIDYLFDNESYPFLGGTDTIATEVLFRDILINELSLLGQNNELWLS